MLHLNFFQSKLNEFTLANIPQTTIKTYQNKPKWWNSQLQQKKNRRDKLFKRKKPGTVSTEYIAAVIEFNVLHQRRYDEYIQRIQENIKTEPAAFWQFAKIENKTATYPNKMHPNNVIADTPNKIVELFANHFESSYAIDDEVLNFNDLVQPLDISTEINVTLDDI